jgi:hypothetical protein
MYLHKTLHCIEQARYMLEEDLEQQHFRKRKWQMIRAEMRTVEEQKYPNERNATFCDEIIAQAEGKYVLFKVLFNNDNCTIKLKLMNLFC